jgi:hypothetical protein
MRQTTKLTIKEKLLNVSTGLDSGNPIGQLCWDAQQEIERLESEKSRAVSDIIAERHRQITAEGWTVDHDDRHMPGEMALAAASYCMTSFPHRDMEQTAKNVWPWKDSWFKPKTRRRDLIRAAALIVAEIERLDRRSP